VLPALVVALSLALTGAASAQTTPFQASVTFPGTLPSLRAGGCANGAFFCGTANVAGYGAASWNFGNVTNPTISDTPCGSTYTATTEFTLVSDPGSTLVLDEGGQLCGLGNDGAAYRGYFAQKGNKYAWSGFPYAIVGNWTVDPTSTGVFSTLVGESGVDLVHVSGAHIAGSYSGTPAG
jgi:hypothetical protein